ncbi:uncharacterized protein ACNLHF_013507 isoform 1-T4 [Anomaloglossus baeobatrachus]|uniref:uncharacterized protein LOC142296159 n=1 Tax=Anomaloglossus baeobatrachus TaxID=238106 RepID=UPI003F5017AF
MLWYIFYRKLEKYHPHLSFFHRTLTIRRGLHYPLLHSYPKACRDHELLNSPNLKGQIPIVIHLLARARACVLLLPQSFYPGWSASPFLYQKTP